MLRILGVLVVIWLVVVGLFWWPGWVSHPVRTGDVAGLNTKIDKLSNQVNALAAATPVPGLTKSDVDKAISDYAAAHPAPTAAAATTTSSTSTYTGGIAAGCPSLQQWRQMTGVDGTIVGNGEPCAYTFNSGDGGGKDIILSKDTIVEWAQPDSSGGTIHVVSGDGTTVNAKASTWRFLSLYPGLTVDSACTLLKNYASAPQNGFVGSIVCGSNTVANSASTTAAATQAPTTCPAINGFSSSVISGGCLYQASSGAADFQVPGGWYAHYGSPAVNGTGDIGKQSTVSLYKGSPPSS